MYQKAASSHIDVCIHIGNYLGTYIHTADRDGLGSIDPFTDILRTVSGLPVQCTTHGDTSRGFVLDCAY